MIGKFNNLDEFYIIAHKVNYIYKKIEILTSLKNLVPTTCKHQQSPPHPQPQPPHWKCGSRIWRVSQFRRSKPYLCRVLIYVSGKT